MLANCGWIVKGKLFICKVNRREILISTVTNREKSGAQSTLIEVN
ncbi:hypothetical protein CMUST_05955 [Corynebacterium mustelae]|uniref:Uncharacterized protein n=1 Tax=Corynebacterium mustelae TaxID=571915 RepID=A0A0G3H310_9CORY|nr:hypothetical protein CMUST_05955 [Corynebacterium mustelae]